MNQQNRVHRFLSRIWFQFPKLSCEPLNSVNPWLHCICGLHKLFTNCGRRKKNPSGAACSFKTIRNNTLDPNEVNTETYKNKLKINCIISGENYDLYLDFE